MEGKSFDKKRTRRSLFVRCGNNISFAAAKKKVRPSVRGATRTAANLFDGPSFVKPNRERDGFFRQLRPHQTKHYRANTQDLYALAPANR